MSLSSSHCRRCNWLPVWLSTYSGVRHRFAKCAQFQSITELQFFLGYDRFALSIDDDPALKARAAEVFAARERGEPTVPTTIAREVATNPFLKAGGASRFGEVRAAKDAFRG